MSGSLGLSPLEAAELAATKIQLGRYVVISLYVVQLCEWVALWDDEWRLIHCTRWTSMKVVYLCCRYYPLISWIFYIWALVGDHELEICQRVLKPLYLLMIPYQLTAQAVMVTRAWAFTGRQTAVLVLLLSAYAVLLGMEIWVFGTNVEIGPSSLRDVGLNTGCVRDSSIGKPSSPHRLGILFMSAFTLDFLCIVIMTVHCIRLRSLQGPLGKTFLQQGFRAFFLMSALHIAAATCALRYYQPLRKYADCFIPPYSFEHRGVSSASSFLMLFALQTIS
ncbi:hypothetical protein FPV67DRAFT_1667513 [Lyophyllum atratum]|nr:hypothetical protein FPV67DRAFT_1667513 [Lyophyllum atratum]